jgi:hypothetical protein
VNLTHDKLTRLNILLRNTNLELPKVRREVLSSGFNYEWLRKNIQKRNTHINDELKTLLNIE